MENQVEMITIEKHIFDFLKVSYFGADKDPLTAASFRAYRDFNRTLRFGDMPEDERFNLKKSGAVILKDKIEELSDIKTQCAFDEWHKNTCDQLMSEYTSKGITFTYGQAQKWLNMTIKYLYIIGACSFKEVFRFCHIPIDKFIIEKANIMFGIPIPATKWSQWTENQYNEYQKDLRSYIKECAPLRWELMIWHPEEK